ncbi:hypothetical protein ASPSYDRAFT_27129 [Aspergillus sydowii CBS 593.65]|uniref:Uncharacterized protein n=1 Tax=Aspergillus sydowii CBS 593.65 TaxID=1036612 RepID=A0A1L9U0F7_9EURO|nr:uncharacterized protein ASPSYDRAFT_27129 [Aspergillus sydowii CBS 593.65]OJJ65180.1 hypothetical protein ASPSYDRAFT_27129 [Aspergillus sydowii CBS 593.65]
MAHRNQQTPFSSFKSSAQKQIAGGEGPNAPRQGNGQYHGTGNYRRQGPGPRCNRGTNKWNASAGPRQTPTWRGARGQYAYPPPEYSPKGSLISGPGQGQNNPNSSKTRNKKGVTPRNNPVPIAPRGLDFDNDSTMSGVPFIYTKKQWRRIQYMRHLRETNQLHKLHYELGHIDSEIMAMDVDAPAAPAAPVFEAPIDRYSDIDMLDVPDNF